MPRSERLVIQPELGQRSRTKVLDDHIALDDQLLEQATPLRVLEVDGDAFLVAIDAEEVRALAFEERRTPRARVVALPRLLDLDHACAHIGQQHRAIGTGEDAREVEDCDAVEWRHNGQMIIVYAGSA